MKRNYLYLLGVVVIGAIAVLFFMNKSPSLTNPQASPELTLATSSEPTTSPQAPSKSIMPNPKPLTQEQVIYTKRKEQSQIVISQFKSTTPPSEKFVWYQALAKADYGLKDYQGAKIAYLSALKSDPKNPLTAQVEAELSAMFVVMKDYTQALVYIQKAATLRPDVPDYWLAYIKIEAEHLNASDSAIRVLYQQAIQKSNNHFVLIEAYAGYLEQKGDLVGALNQWRTLLQIYPNNQDALDNISRLEQTVR